MLKKPLRTLAWLLPASRNKNKVLTALGHEIHPTAVASACLVLDVDEFVMGPHARIGRANVVRNMRAVRVGSRCSVGRLNVIIASPRWNGELAVGASLVLEPHGTITSRHRLDCTGGVTVGEFAIVAGHESRFFSLEVDLVTNADAARPITIGKRSFIGARCNVLAGARFPDRSVLAAASVFGPGETEAAAGVWAGNPAQRKGPIEGKWFERDMTGTRNVYIPQEDRVQDNAL